MQDCIIGYSIDLGDLALTSAKEAVTHSYTFRSKRCMTTIAGIFSGVRFGVQSICLSDIAYAWCDQRVHVFG